MAEILNKAQTIRAEIVPDWGRFPDGNQITKVCGVAVVHAIAIGENDRIVASDRYHGRMELFDKNGTFMREIGGFNWPEDGDFDRDGNIAVCELDAPIVENRTGKKYEQ